MEWLRLFCLFDLLGDDLLVDLVCGRRETGSGSDSLCWCRELRVCIVGPFSGFVLQVVNEIRVQLQTFREQILLLVMGE